ncbi:MAG: hypothetical protein V4439_03305 [Patescibacteria group bacterium]
MNTEQKINRAFGNAKYEPENGLILSIWNTISTREKRIAKVKFWAFSALGVVSLAGFVPVFKALVSDFAQSGFYEYLSLAFGSGGSVSLFWKELALSIAESLPVFSIILLLGVVFIFFLSVRYAMKEIIRGQLSLSF